MNAIELLLHDGGLSKSVHRVAGTTGNNLGGLSKVGIVACKDKNMGQMVARVDSNSRILERLLECDRVRMGRIRRLCRVGDIIECLTYVASGGASCFDQGRRVQLVPTLPLRSSAGRTAKKSLGVECVEKQGQMQEGKNTAGAIRDAR